MAELLPTMRHELALLRTTVAASPTTRAPSTDPCNHTALLDLAEALIAQAGPTEWRLSIHLETVTRDLDEQSPETVH